MRTPPRSKVPPTSVSGNETKFAVKAQNAAYRSTSARPNVPRICASIGPLAICRTKAQVDHHAEEEQQRGGPGMKKTGPSFSRVKAKKAAYIASMTKSPWAKLTTFIMPQISVRPDENSAYTDPISRPLTTTCNRITPSCSACLNGAILAER